MENQNVCTITADHAAAGERRRLIRLPEVLNSVGLSRSEWYRLISLGRAPRPVKLGERATAFVEAEVQAWIAARVKERSPKVA